MWLRLPAWLQILLLYLLFVAQGTLLFLARGRSLSFSLKGGFLIALPIPCYIVFQLARDRRATP